MSRVSAISEFEEDDIFALEICLDDKCRNLEERLLKARQLRDKLKGALFHDAIHTIQSSLVSRGLRINGSHDLFTNGVNCKLLKFGSTHWQAGRIKVSISIEFVADEIETLEENLDRSTISPGSSPLDEIRQIIDDIV